MTIIHVDDVLRVLRVAPADGLTTAEVAERLNKTPEAVSGRLSKLATYGKLDREMKRCTCGHRYYCWRLKELAHA